MMVSKNSNPSGRSLTPGEIAGLPPGLVAAVPEAEVMLISANHPLSVASQAIGRSALIVVRGRHIFWPRLARDMSGNAVLMSILAHEMVHVWQYHNGMTLWRYMLRAVVQGRYGYRLRADRPFTAYGYEQQAAMVEDWMRLGSGLPAHYGRGGVDRAGLAAIIPFL